MAKKISRFLNRTQLLALNLREPRKVVIQKKKAAPPLKKRKKKKKTARQIARKKKLSKKAALRRKRASRKKRLMLQRLRLRSRTFSPTLDKLLELSYFQNRLHRKSRRVRRRFVPITITRRVLRSICRGALLRRWRPKLRKNSIILGKSPAILPSNLHLLLTLRVKQLQPVRKRKIRRRSGNKRRMFPVTFRFWKRRHRRLMGGAAFRSCFSSTFYSFNSAPSFRNFFYQYSRPVRRKRRSSLNKRAIYRCGPLTLLTRTPNRKTVYTNISTLLTRLTLYKDLLRHYQILFFRCFINSLRKRRTTKVTRGLKRRTIKIRKRLLTLMRLITGLSQSLYNYYILLTSSKVIQLCYHTRKISLLRFTKRRIRRSLRQMRRYARFIQRCKKAIERQKKWKERQRKKFRGMRRGRSDALSYRLMRRFARLITKRGGRHRAYRVLEEVLYAMKPTRRQFRLILTKKRKKPKSPVLKALKNLKTYFYLRKFTKSRRTTFIPGILSQPRRLSVVARWLSNAAKKNPERDLHNRIFSAILQASKNRGFAKQMQLSFHKIVTTSKGSLNKHYRKRRRRGFIQKRVRRLPNWRDVARMVKNTKKEILRNRHRIPRHWRAAKRNHNKWNKRNKHTPRNDKAPKQPPQPKKIFPWWRYKKTPKWVIAQRQAQKKQNYKKPKNFTNHKKNSYKGTKK